MPKAPQQKTSRTSDGKRQVHGKVANGEGTVYWHASVGAWRASYVANGQRRYVQAATRDRVLAKRDAAKAEGLRVKRGSTRFTASTTAAQFGEWWLETEVRHNVVGGSIDEYRKRIKRLGPLGQVPMGDVRSEDLIGWLSALLDAGAARTAASSRLTVRSMFARAAELGVITANPAAGLRAPKVEKTPGRALDQGDTHRLIDATSEYRYAAVVHIMFTLGLRVSEVLGLCWEDVDLDKGTAFVRFAVSYNKREGVHLGPPKTKGAKGTHHLAPGAVQALRKWRIHQAADRLASPTWPERGVDMVFTKEDGGLVSRQHIDTLIRETARSLNIDDTGLGTHAGRRTVITELRRAGVSIDDIARHVGHASTETTRGYVADEGERPKATADVAAQRLDRVN